MEHDSRVLSLVKKTGLKKTVSNLLEQLKICQKALNEFLEVQYSNYLVRVLVTS